MAGTTGVYMLQLRHAAAIQQLASSAEVAATTRIPHPYPDHGAEEFLKIVDQQRHDGTGYAFAIEDSGTLVGVCGLHEIDGDTAGELGYWIGRPYWGRGYASFGVKMLLEFAFHNLRLRQVRAVVLQQNPASRRVLEKNGFRATAERPNTDPWLKVGNATVVDYEITADDWREFRDRPILAKLHPDLMAIVNRELAMGNEILETGQGWPDPDSMFVRLKLPFKTAPNEVPDTVEYLEVNDPHWWKAEFHSLSPRHIVAY